MAGNLAFVAFGVMAESAANVVANGGYFVLNARGWWKWKEDPPASNNEGERDCAAANQSTRTAGK
jgi:hypothetical protein